MHKYLADDLRDAGAYDLAIAEYSAAVEEEPKNSWIYRSRGLAYLFAGFPEKALADFSQASELDPKDAYTALWLDVAGQKVGVMSRLPEAVATLDMTKWPAPIVRLYLGQMTPAAVLAALDDAGSQTKIRQTCEVNFYAGELAKLKGATEEGLRQIRLAADQCPLTFLEWHAATAELKALGSTP